MRVEPLLEDGHLDKCSFQSLAGYSASLWTQDAMDEGLIYFRILSQQLFISGK